MRVNLKRINVYCGMVVPILCYASQVWYPTKTDLIRIELVQKRPTRWIVDAELLYIDRLVKLKLLPLSLYIEMHDILLFAAIINNNYDFDWSQHILFSNDHGYYTRTTASCRLQVPKLRLSKSNQNFWLQCARLANHLSHSIDLFCITGVKRKLSDIYWNYFYLH